MNESNVNLDTVVFGLNIGNKSSYYCLLGDLRSSKRLEPLSLTITGDHHKMMENP